MNAIRGCDALESISLPNVEKVGNFCFAENPKLKEVDLPKATSLGTKAFDKCTALTTLKLGATTAITLATDTFTSPDRRRAAMEKPHLEIHRLLHPLSRGGVSTPERCSHVLENSRRAYRQTIIR